MHHENSGYVVILESNKRIHLYIAEQTVVHEYRAQTIFIIARIIKITLTISDDYAYHHLQVIKR